MIPCYFDLLLEDNPLGLVFKVSTQLIEYYQLFDNELLALFGRKLCLSHDFFKRFAPKDEPSNQGLFDDYYQSLDLQAARGLFGKYFGNGQTMALADKDQEFWCWRAIIPEGMIIFNRQICPDCQGSKLDQEKTETFSREIYCGSCAGSGLKTIKQQNLAKELADNVCLLLDVVRILSHNCDKSTADQQPMLMFLQTNNEGYGRQTICGYYTEEFKNFLLDVLARQAEKKLMAAISQRMMSVYNLMWWGKNYFRYEKVSNFPAELESRRDSRGKDEPFFYLQVPGVNGCNVYPCSDSSIFPPKSEEEVYSLTCHNIDRSDQQLALIVGLAYLCSLARAWLEKNK